MASFYIPLPRFGSRLDLFWEILGPRAVYQNRVTWLGLVQMIQRFRRMEHWVTWAINRTPYDRLWKKDNICFIHTRLLFKKKKKNRNSTDMKAIYLSLGSQTLTGSLAEATLIFFLRLNEFWTKLSFSLTDAVAVWILKCTWHFLPAPLCGTLSWRSSLGLLACQRKMPLTVDKCTSWQAASV